MRNITDFSNEMLHHVGSILIEKEVIPLHFRKN